MTNQSWSVWSVCVLLVPPIMAGCASIGTNAANSETSGPSTNEPQPIEFRTWSGGDTSRHLTPEQIIAAIDGVSWAASDKTTPTIGTPPCEHAFVPFRPDPSEWTSNPNTDGE